MTDRRTFLKKAAVASAAVACTPFLSNCNRVESSEEQRAAINFLSIKFDKLRMKLEAAASHLFDRYKEYFGLL